MAGQDFDSQYLHGTTPDEQDRLSRLNALVNDLSLTEMQLQAGERVLDVGSGLGQLTRAMARKVGAGRVVGVERSSEQIAESRRLASEANEADLVAFRQGDAAQLPLRDDEWGTFDTAHARWILEHVTHPLAVVQGMLRAVKPGGRIILEDDSHDVMRLWPEPPGFDRLWKCYMRTYERVGNDPFIGHRLVALLQQAGAVPGRNIWLFFGACAGQPELLTAYVENLARIFEGVRSQILDLGEVDAAMFDLGLIELRKWSKRPDAAFWYAISWVEGHRAD